MSYTGNLAGNPVDYVRFLIGDTYPKREALTDDEIAALIALNPGNIQAAALAACNGAIAKLNYLFNQSVGSVSVSYGDWAKNFISTLARLKTEQNLAGGYSAYAGGVSEVDKWAVESNPDRPPRYFKNDDRNAAPWQRGRFGYGAGFGPWRGPGGW